MSWARIGVVSTATIVLSAALSGPLVAQERDFRPMEPTVLRPVPGFGLSCIATTEIQDYSGSNEERSETVTAFIKVTEHENNTIVTAKLAVPGADDFATIKMYFDAEGLLTGDIQIESGISGSEESEQIRLTTGNFVGDTGNVVRGGADKAIPFTKEQVSSIFGQPPEEVDISEWDVRSSWVGETDLSPFGTVLFAHWSVFASLSTTSDEMFFSSQGDEMYDPQSGLKVSTNWSFDFQVEELVLQVTYSSSCQYTDTPEGYIAR
ncbi:MAG: hypothetical protein GKS02_03180 [Alphaproteobacteria bacterium]|nr:hypothetical protein [Alphaproteobacteria bacterium]